MSNKKIARELLASDDIYSSVIKLNNRTKIAVQFSPISVARELVKVAKILANVVEPRFSKGETILFGNTNGLWKIIDINPVLLTYDIKSVLTNKTMTNVEEINIRPI